MTQILGIGKLGTILLIISIILIVAGYYFTPNIENFFGLKILVEDNPRVNFFIRLYGGFLASSAMTLVAQFILWVLRKSIQLSMDTSSEYLDDVKSVRNISVFILLLLAGILYFVAGKTIVRI